MYVYTDPPKVNKAIPSNYAKDVKTDQPLVLVFSADLDQTSIPGAIEITDELGRSLPLAGADGKPLWRYDSRTKTLSFLPEGGWSPNTTYRILVRGDHSSAGGKPGIRSLVGIPMLVDFTLVFVTAGLKTPAAPVPLRPADESLVDTSGPLEFAWTAVENAVAYEIEIAQNPRFDPLYLSTDGCSTTTWTPGTELEAATYFWRVRVSRVRILKHVEKERLFPVGEERILYASSHVNWAMDVPVKVYASGKPLDLTAYEVDYDQGMIRFMKPRQAGDVITVSYAYATEEELLGEWSPVFRFAVRALEPAPVWPGGEPPIDVLELDTPIEVLETFPEDGFASVGTNLKSIIVRIDRPLPEHLITPDLFEGYSEPVADPSGLERHESLTGTVRQIEQPDGTALLVWELDPLDLGG